MGAQRTRCLGEDGVAGGRGGRVEPGGEAAAQRGLARGGVEPVRRRVRALLEDAGQPRERARRAYRAPAPLRDRAAVYPLQSGGHRSLFMRQEVCCQKYIHPDMGKCGYCGLRPVQEQLQLQQTVFDRQVAGLPRKSFDSL